MSKSIAFTLDHTTLHFEYESTSTIHTLKSYILSYLSSHKTSYTCTSLSTIGIILDVEPGKLIDANLLLPDSTLLSTIMKPITILDLSFNEILYHSGYLNTQVNEKWHKYYYQYTSKSL